MKVLHKLKALVGSWFALFFLISLLCFDGLIVTKNARANFAESSYTKESKQILQQLQEHIESTLRRVADIEAQAGNKTDAYFYSVSEPARNEDIYIGLIMDEEPGLKGYRVLSVTPGGLAEKLQISEGDVILSINFIEITERSKSQALHELRRLRPGDTLHLAILHQDEYRELDAQISTTYLPEYSLRIGNNSLGEEEWTGCGEISVAIDPPETQELYRVIVKKIDGKPAQSSIGNIRLSEGVHTIELKEYIKDPYFARRRGEMMNVKTLELDIKPDTRFHLAAKFNRNRRSKLAEGGYWEPVVWKETEKECRP